MAGDNSTTSTTTNEPYAAAKPLLDQGMGDALNLYKSGNLIKPNTMNTVVPYAKQTTAGMNNIQANSTAAMGANPLGNVLGNAGSTFASPNGLTSMQQAASNTLAPFMYGAGNVDTSNMSLLANQGLHNPYASYFTDIANGGQNLSSSAQSNIGNKALNNPFSATFAQMAGASPASMAEQNLMNIAKGGFINRNDPNFEKVLGRATENTAGQVNALASGMGRYGSGTQQGVLAREVGDLQANARLNQYNTERGRQVEAINRIDAARNTAFGNRLNAANSGAGNYLSGLGQALNAANSASNIQSGNRDAIMNAIAGGTNDFRSGLNSALNTASNVANITGSNYDRALGAMGQYFNAGQAGLGNIGNAGSVYQSLLSGQNAPANNLMGVGSMYEDLAGRGLNDKLRIANESQNAPLANLQALLAAANGAGSYSTGTTTAQGPSNTFSNVIGGGLGGLSLLRGLNII